jgi:hypothetical protein
MGTARRSAHQRQAREGYPLREADVSADLKQAITDFLHETPCTDGARKFLIRLRNGENRCINSIWQGYIDVGIATNTAEQRAAFIRSLYTMWRDSLVPEVLVELNKAIRAIGKAKGVASKMLAPWIESKKPSLKDKVQVANLAASSFQSMADAEERLAKGKQALARFDLRSDKGGSRRRTVFMRSAADCFYQKTGQWHDNWVADLTDVAFPDRDTATTIDMVCSARRGMRPLPKP